MKIIIQIPPVKSHLKEEILKEVSMKMPHDEVHFEVSPNDAIIHSVIPEGDDRTAKEQLASGALSQLQTILLPYQQ